MSYKQVVWPAAVYDAIKAKADARGGVGAGAMLHKDCPLCIYGLAWEAGVIKAEHPNDLYEVDDSALYGVTYARSDEAVERVEARGGASGWGLSSRVPFDAWAETARVVRGES